MYLSKLEIFGFKSFANKTNLVLNDGITAIVGPNGCGKTNIVDALRWALGEQRYATLRSDKMEDVIFNGTKTRKPVGLAEVSITVHNNKGVLPVDYNELTITRRVYRSGESDYLLNKTICRLKDITSLFMDTGMGPNAYSVIELKMVESILSDKIEERRRLFEEAAGVTKYKARRKEAYRKLAEVDADLIRIDDIISEVTKTVNSLNRQAKKAERYTEFIDRLQKLEIDVLQRDYTSVVLRLEPLEIKLSSSLLERNAMYGTIETEDARLQDQRRDERAIEQHLETLRSNDADLHAQLSETEQYIRVNQERERALQENIQRLNSENETNEQRLSQIDEEKKQIFSSLDVLAEDLQLLESKADEQRQSHRTIDEAVSNKKAETEARQNRRMYVAQEISRAQSEIEQRKARAAAIQERLEKIQAEEQEIAGAIGELRRTLEEVGVGQTDLSESVLAAEREFHAMEDRKQALRGEIDVLQNRAFDLQALMGEKMTRIDFLNGLVDRLEGYSESVQYLLRSRDWGRSSHGTIADVINTRDQFRVAVEAALGEAAHYILVNDTSEAVNGLLNLKDQKKGKATFACLAQLPEFQAATFAVAGDGVIGWAVDNVKYAGTYDKLFQYLLKNTLIVRDEAIAQLCIREYPNIRCVTLAGDVFDSNGIVRGGSHSQDEGGLIGKKDQIATLTKEVEELKKQLHENQKVLEARNFDYSDIDLKHYAEQMRQSQQNLSAHERRIAQYVFEIEKHERTLQKNAEERATLEAEIREIDEKLNLLFPMIADSQTQQLAVEAEINLEAEALQKLEQDYNHSNDALNRAHIAVVEKRSEIQNLRNEFERLTTSYTETQSRLVFGAQEIVHAQQAKEELSQAISSLSGKLDTISVEQHGSSSLLQEAETQLAAKREEISALEQKLHEERHKHNQIVTLVHELELKVSELHQKLTMLHQRAEEEFDLKLDLISTDEEDVFDLAQAKEEISDLKVKVKTLGLVNPLAFEEWKQEKERMDLLVTQRQDLVESQKTLNDTISEINLTAKQKFSETFAQVRSNFVSIFQSLFDEGDEADLLIEDDVDPLEARIEIVAKPRGKRPHSIEMLSGGEKTLTAIALLFAIYLVKPSPFCILDEVDAPLDDANIDRYIKIIRRFARNTQFIVVTHNKRTMAAADTLYGVTMEEEGVSKIVAVDFNSDSLARFAQN
jgi:chromosome segregation protein